MRERMRALWSGAALAALLVIAGTGSAATQLLGADLVFAWPRAQLGVMGPRQAVGIVHRRDIAASADPEAAAGRFARAYAEEHLGARQAAEVGAIDEVIAPADTRARLAHALHLLEPR